MSKQSRANFGIAGVVIAILFVVGMYLLSEAGHPEQGTPLPMSDEAKAQEQRPMFIRSAAGLYWATCKYMDRRGTVEGKVAIGPADNPETMAGVKILSNDLEHEKIVSFKEALCQFKPLES